MDDTSLQTRSPDASGEASEAADDATWRAVQRIGAVAASISGLFVLLLMLAIDPGTRGSTLALVVVLGVAAGYVVATLAATTWIQSHGRRVRRPKDERRRTRFVLPVTVALVPVAMALLVLIGRATAPLPLATIFVVAPICALVADEIVDRVVLLRGARP
jgi:ABC-type nickel/cobalt efflux system permease component RcnA